MEEIIRKNWHKRAANLQASGPTATPTGECIHDGCNLSGWDRTEGYCSVHYVTNVVSEIEEILHDANENWIASVYAESNAKPIWRCICGFYDTYENRESHFMANDGDAGHGPPIRNQLVQSTKTVASGGRKRVTEKQTINLDEVG
jgi:hypothetical protein